jgi:Sigma-70, region 4/Short repeat of unknown function (DUF308)
MNSVLGQQLWKGTLVSGVLTIVLGVMVLVWPGPTILVASTMFGVYLLVSGLVELFLAFEEVTEQRLVDSYTRSAPAGLRSAEDQALDSLPDNDIKSAMQALPAQFRDVVYYADVEGLRYQEIAAIMNTPTGTVASQLYRGRRHLRRLLDGGVGGAGTETMCATV